MLQRLSSEQIKLTGKMWTSEPAYFGALNHRVDTELTFARESLE